MLALFRDNEYATYASTLREMIMNAFQIFGLQTTLSLIVYALIAKWYVWPRLTALPLSAALVPLLLVHAMRHIGTTVLMTGVIEPATPQAFTVPLAYGDLV